MKNIFLALLLVIVGCATGSRFMMGKAHPAISPEDVKVYDSMPERSEKIALLHATANSLKINSCVEEIRRQAAAVGANGIVISGSDAGYFRGATVSATAIFVP